jgi:cytochrome c biogenesis protein CcdA
VLSGLAICAALTALIAGVTGAWSPCGFSMVQTIGSALGDGRRGATRAASVTFGLGAVIGGVITFGGLAELGRLIGDGTTGLREGLGAALALAAAMADWRGVKIAPQIRRQVPERWRWSTPLAFACGLYGILLGLAFTTFVLAFAVWALAGISFAAGDPLLGAIVGVAFGLGRALPVLWMAPSFDNGGEGARRLDDMASEPRMWLGLRRLDAIGLSLCALFLSGASATAAVLPNATDPSAALGALVWQQVGGPGVLRAPSGQASTLPGGYPALGGSMIAWENSGQLTVADLATLTPRVTIPVTRLNALAVSDSWIVYRDQGPRGEEALVGVPLTDPTQRLSIATSTLASEIGRPALNGSDVVFTYDTPQRSAIEIVHLASGARHVLRATYRNAVLLNPSILGGRLLYERVDRCRQQLRIALIGSPGHPSHGHDHVLLSLPSTVKRDPGYQRGYEHAYNSASLCPNRATRHGFTTRLGPTALSGSAAYVTEIPSNPGDAHIITVSR